jgi:hypothetical protein
VQAVAAAATAAAHSYVAVRASAINDDIATAIPVAPIIAATMRAAAAATAAVPVIAAAPTGALVHQHCRDSNERPPTSPISDGGWAGKIDTGKHSGPLDATTPHTSWQCLNRRSSKLR